jgi:hypothetical protein
VSRVHHGTSHPGDPAITARYRHAYQFICTRGGRLERHAREPIDGAVLVARVRLAIADSDQGVGCSRSAGMYRSTASRVRGVRAHHLGASGAPAVVSSCTGRPTGCRPAMSRTHEPAEPGGFGRDRRPGKGSGTLGAGGWRRP